MDLEELAKTEKVGDEAEKESENAKYKQALKETYKWSLGVCKTFFSNTTPHTPLKKPAGAISFHANTQDELSKA